VEDPIREAKEKLLIKEVKFIEKVKIQDKDVDPYIVIDVVDGKIRVIINKPHFYGTLSKKNDIQQCLDVALVDYILEHLNELSDKEQDYYKKQLEDKK
jgi:hypothetical protein